MNVCLVSYGFPDFKTWDTSGISTYTFWMARGLAEQGHQVFVLSPGISQKDGEVVGDNIRVWRVPVGNVHYYASKLPYVRHTASWLKHQEIGWAAAHRIQFLADRFGLDIVEAYGPINSMWRLARWSQHIPYVVVIHGLPFSFKRYLGLRFHLTDHLGDWVHRHALKQAAAVICPSTFVANEVCQMSLHPAKVHLVPCPISPQFVAYARGQVAEMHRGPIILSVSPINTAKGLDTLVSAIPIVAKAIPGIRFVHIGKAEDRHLANALTRETNGAAQLISPIPWPSVSDYYKAATIVVSPSRFETAGYTILEGMIHGKPVVASNVGGLTDLVEDGKTGFLVPPGDPKSLGEALVKLLRETELWQEMGEQGRARALDVFGLERVTRKKVELYRTLQSRA